MKDDESIFRELHADIAPLKQDKVELNTQNTQSASLEIRRESAVKRASIYDNFLTEAEVAPVEPEEILTYKLPGVQTFVFKQLRQGKYSIDDHLDLHRHTVAEARSALFQFIRNARKHDCRTLLVTHGKGLRSTPPARLKSFVYHWLQQFNEVLAFHSAQNKHGGTGSVYVLLRKSDEKRLENKEIYQ